MPVDTGFIVYNDRTYPNFIRFLTELGIQGEPTEMSFSYYDQARDRAYAGTNLAGLFACRRNLVSPGFWAFLFSVGRFNLRAANDLKRGGLEGIGLEQYLRRIKAPPRLRSDYLGPMTQAIWSVPGGQGHGLSGGRFHSLFDNHGLLSMPGRITWRYLKGGSRTYLETFQSQFPGEIRLGVPVSAVERPADGVPEVHFKGGSQGFDAVVIAAHADQALSMLPDADGGSAPSWGLGAITATAPCCTTIRGICRPEEGLGLLEREQAGGG
jgi:predicted NAD/FAD-binding protein